MIFESIGIYLAEPDQQGYFDHFPLISTPTLQGILISLPHQLKTKTRLIVPIFRAGNSGQGNRKQCVRNIGIYDTKTVISKLLSAISPLKATFHLTISMRE